jgi:hypothetical protein
MAKQDIQWRRDSVTNGPPSWKGARFVFCANRSFSKSSMPPTGLLTAGRWLLYPNGAVDRILR